MSVMAGYPRVLAPRRPIRSGGSAARLVWLRRMSLLALALLVVIANTAAYGIYTVVHRGPFSSQVVAWSAGAMLVALAMMFMLLGRYAMQRCLAHIEAQLRTLVREERIESIDGPVPDELRAVMTALRDYVDQVMVRMDHLRLQKKELSIQMKAAEAERRHTEAIIYSISDGVLVVDPFGELVLANSAAETLFGFDLKQARRRPIERVLDDNTLVNLIKEARDLGADGGRRMVEYSALRNGRNRVFNITLSTIMEGNGESRGVVAVFHDVTRDREIAQIKTDFVSAVSHELRTPLSSIRAYIEMLLDGEAPDEATKREFYQIIETQTERLQRMVSNVLDISRIEAGVADSRWESIAINEVITDVVKVISPQAAEKEIEVVVDPDDGLPLIRADRDMLHQAVMNLVSNAIKYTNKGGWVRITTRQDEASRRLVLTIRDNGVGITSEDLPRIFDKFYRTRDAGALAKGTGLGLNLVKHIIETVHHGDISVTSERGVGTTFVVRLPLHVA